MTAETVFHAIKQGEVSSPTISHQRNAWRKGGAPRGLDDVCSLQQDSVDDLLHGAIIHSGNDAASPWPKIAGNERIFADMMTKRARDSG